MKRRWGQVLLVCEVVALRGLCQIQMIFAGVGVCLSSFVVVVVVFVVVVVVVAVVVVSARVALRDRSFSACVTVWLLPCHSCLGQFASVG